MDFQLFKPHLKRTNLVVMISSLILLLIGLIIVLTIKNLDVKTTKVPLAILIVLNYLLIMLITWLLNHSKTFVSFTFLFVTYKYEIDQKTKQTTKFQVNWQTYLIIISFLVVLYFVELTATINGYDNNWIKAAKNNWWTVLILIASNLILIIGSYLLTWQLLNHDQKLIAAMSK